MPSMNQRKFMEQYSANPPTLSSDFKASDGTPAVWAPNMPACWGSEAASISFDTRISSFAFSPDDVLIAVSVGKVIHIYNVATLDLVQILEGHPSDVGKMAFVPKARLGYRLASSSTGYRGADSGPMIVWWDLNDEGKDCQAPAEPVDVDGLSKYALASVLNGISGASWSKATSQSLEQDFRKAITAAVGKEGLVGRTVIHGSFAGFGSEIFSKDGNYMFVKAQHTDQSDKGIDVWDSQTMQLSHKLVGHTDYIAWIGASPDSKLVASISWDGTVRIWSLATGDCLHNFGNFGGQMWAGAWSPDSKYLAFSQGSPKTFVYVYDVETGKEISKYEGINHWARSMDWSPDGKFLASGADQGLLCIWDPMTGEERMRWELKFADQDRMMWSFISVGQVKFVGMKLVFQSTEGTIEVYDLERNLKSEYKRRPTQVISEMGKTMMPSHNGHFLVSGDGDNNLRFWKL